MKKLLFLMSLCLTIIVFALPLGVVAAEDNGGGPWVIKIKDSVSSFSALSGTINGIDEEDSLEYEKIGDSLYCVTDDYEAAQALADSGVAEYVEETTYSYLSYVPNDRLYAPSGSGSSASSYQYALKLLNAEQGWDITRGSNDVRIVVIDSGFDYSHEDGANIKAGYDYIDNRTNTYDYSWHGTACAGIIGATTGNSLGIAGAAPNCQVYMLRCFGLKDNEQGGDNMAIAKAIRDAVDVYDADVISMSFGSLYNPTYLYDAVKYAYDKGVIMVAATGNTGADYGYAKNKLEYPAAYDEVIGVASVDWTKEAAATSTKNKSTYVSAPGCSILTLGNTKKYANYISADGTSFATPYVASLAALALSIDPSLTPDDFRVALRHTSDDRGAAGYDYSYGYGIVNYGALLTMVSEGKFLDVPEGKWYSEAVYDLKSLNILNGRSKFYFEPAGTIKRCEFATILAKMSGDDLSSYNSQSGFSDIKSTDWFANYMNWGISKGIIKGYGDGTARPSAYITREEMCVMFNRYIAMKGVALTDNGAGMNFSDVGKISDWAYADVAELVSGGIIEGNDDNTFNPLGNSSRAEVAVMIDRFIKAYGS